MNDILINLLAKQKPFDNNLLFYFFERHHGYRA